MEDADSVELKLTVPDEDRFSAAAALGVDPLAARIRQVFFFDTPDLALDKAGVVVRARRTQGTADDTVVKLRPVIPGELPPRLRQREDFVVEVDGMPGGYVCSASFKGKARTDVAAAAAGREPLRKLFTKQQKAFFADHAPNGLKMDDLSVLGPVNTLKLKLVPAGFDRKLAVELWFYPNGTRILELSTKCAPAEWLATATSARSFLIEKGVDLEAEQTTKTRTALEYFAGLAGSSSAARNSSAALTRLLTSCASASPSLRKIALMCFSTARLVSTSDSAIAVLLLPSAISASTSRSRGVSSASGERSARARAVTSTSTILGSITEPPRGHGADRRGQLAAVVHALLEQVAAAVRARLEQLQHVGRLGVLAEHHHADGRVRSRAGARPPGCPRRCARAACGCR